MYERYKANEAAKEKANQTLKRLQEGEDFAAVAREASEVTAADQEAIWESYPPEAITNWNN